MVTALSCGGCADFSSTFDHRLSAVLRCSERLTAAIALDRRRRRGMVVLVLTAVLVVMAEVPTLLVVSTTTKLLILAASSGERVETP